MITLYRTAVALSIIVVLTAFVAPIGTPTQSPTVLVVDQLPVSRDSPTLHPDYTQPETLYLDEARVSFLLACRCTPDKLPE